MIHLPTGFAVGSWPMIRVPLLLCVARAAVLLVMVPASAGFAHATIADSARPNFLLILTDDHGYGDVSAYRQADIQTPHIDSLATEGMLFLNMRANCTVCSPSRAALLTGRYPDRVGVPGVIRTDPSNSWGWFDPSVPTLAHELKQAGYHTALVGKWHLGLESPHIPNERGFDFFHGFLGDMMDSYTTHLRHGHNYMRRNADIIQPNGHATDLFSDWAVDYLRDRARQPTQPFFLFLAYNAPHFPIEPPAHWLERVNQRLPGLAPARALNVAFVEHLDDAIGRVLAALREAGLEQNTVVVFTSDNGGSLPHAQNNDPWRDGKQSHYDGGLRVPFIARWPLGIAPGSQNDYAGLIFDLFPTFLNLAKAEVPADLDAVSLLKNRQDLQNGSPITSLSPSDGERVPAGRVRGDGVVYSTDSSVSSLFQDGTIDTPRDLYFVRREGGLRYGGKSYEAIIRGNWKLLQNDPYSPLELYNLQQDPYESTNLAGQNLPIFRELAAALRHHIQRGGAAPWQPPDR
jgi:arylsulfatase A-like enzyme